MTGDEVLRRLQILRRGAKGFQDFQRLQIRYGHECFLRRLARSPHRNDFVLKGAMLFSILEGEGSRNTKDADFQVYGHHDVKSIARLFADVCRIEVDDGIGFVANRISVTDEGGEREYPGFGVDVPARLGSSPLTLHFDVGFGEAVTPHPIEVELPMLLTTEKPKTRIYPWETVIAEKFQAMVWLGMSNTRMKDFYDIAEIASRREFDGALLAEAVHRTFEARKTALPATTPICLTPEFFGVKRKLGDWKAFLARHSLPKKTKLGECCVAIEAFVMPVVQFLTGQGAQPGTWDLQKWV